MGQWVSSNHNHADEYMGSSLPFATGSVAVADGVAKEVKFPYVTRWVQVFNNGTNELRVGWTENGVEANPVSNSNYFVVEGGRESARLEVKCERMFFAGNGNATTFSLVAGYTNIPANRFLNLTGSEGFQGVG